MMKEISFLLDETYDFYTLVSVFEKIFNASLKIINKDGRLIASGTNEHYYITLVDKYDDVSPILCDEHYSLKLRITFDKNFSYQEEENRILTIFLKHNVAWVKGTWSIESIHHPPRIIYFK